jgi:hypothetical protein
MFNIPFWVAIPVVALFIPITAIIMDGMHKMKEREHQHRERLKAMELGLPQAVVPPPAESRKSDKPRARSASYHGAVWSGLGAGLLAATMFSTAGNVGDDLRGLAQFLRLWSFPALGVGIGLLLYGILSRNGHGSTPS